MREGGNDASYERSSNAGEELKNPSALVQELVEAVG
jgi:hypothetical protein